MDVMHHVNQKQAILALEQELDHEFLIEETVLWTLEKLETIQIHLQGMDAALLVFKKLDTPVLEQVLAREL
jgi:hypothetical protein